MRICGLVRKLTIVGNARRLNWRFAGLEVGWCKSASELAYLKSGPYRRVLQLQQAFFNFIIFFFKKIGLCSAMPVN